MDLKGFLQNLDCFFAAEVPKEIELEGPKPWKCMCSGSILIEKSCFGYAEEEDESRLTLNARHICQLERESIFRICRRPRCSLWMGRNAMKCTMNTSTTTTYSIASRLTQIQGRVCCKPRIDTVSNSVSRPVIAKRSQHAESRRTEELDWNSQRLMSIWRGFLVIRAAGRGNQPQEIGGEFARTWNVRESSSRIRIWPKKKPRLGAGCTWRGCPSGYIHLGLLKKSGKRN